MFGILALVAAASAQPELPTVFGVQLGTPITLPECERVKDRFPSSDGKKRPYAAVQSHTCHLLSPNDATVGGIRFLPEELPLIVKADYAVTRVIDGNVESIGVSTLGFMHVDEIMRQLKEKFGQPTHTAIEPKIFGSVSAPSLTAEWEKDTYRVEYHSFGGSYSEGSLRVETAIAVVRNEQDDRMKAVKRTPL